MHVSIEHYPQLLSILNILNYLQYGLQRKLKHYYHTLINLNFRHIQNNILIYKNKTTVLLLKILFMLRKVNK